MSKELESYYESAVGSMLDAIVEPNGLLHSKVVDDDGKAFRLTIDGGKPLRIARFGKIEGEENQIDNIENTVVVNPLCESLTRPKDSQFMAYFKGISNMFLNARIVEIADYLTNACLEKKKLSPSLSKQLEFMDGAKSSILQDLNKIVKAHDPKVADKRFVHFTTERKAQVDGKLYQCVAKCIYPTLPEEDETKHLFDVQLGSKASRSRLFKLFELLMVNMEDSSYHNVKTQQQIAPTWYAYTKAIGQFHEHLNEICVLLENHDDAPESVDLTFMEHDADLKKFKSMIPVSILCQGTSDEIEAEVKRLEEEKQLQEHQQQAVGTNGVRIASTSFTRPSNTQRRETVETRQVVHEQRDLAPQPISRHQPQAQPNEQMVLVPISQVGAYYQQPAPVPQYQNANDTLAALSQAQQGPQAVDRFGGQRQRTTGGFTSPGSSRVRGNNSRQEVRGRSITGL